MLRALLAVASLALALPVRAQLPGFEDLARTTALTAADELRLGQGFIDTMGWYYGELDDPERLARVQALTDSIVAVSDKPDQIFTVRLVDDPTVNAAAVPGGFLLINRGLLDTLSDDEVAFVVAHEISHVQLRHFATSLNMNRALQALDTMQTQRANGERDAVADAAVEIEKMTTHYARNLELEADLYGLLYAVRAGYPVGVGERAMTSMLAAVGEVPSFMKDSSTHPPFSERIEQLGLGRETVLETHGLFDAGVAYARAGEHRACVGAFTSFLTLFPKSAAAWSNLGVCHLHEALKTRTDDPWHDDLPLYLQPDVRVRKLDKAAMERARAAFAKALAIDPNRDAALASLGVLARLSGDRRSAQELTQKARELDPDYAGYLNNMGVLQAEAKAWKAAEPWFRRALKADPGHDKAKANLARVLMERRQRTPASELYEELLARPAFAQEAHEALVFMGLRQENQRPNARPAPEAEDSELAVLIAWMEQQAEAEAGAAVEAEAGAGAAVEVEAGAGAAVEAEAGAGAAVEAEAPPRPPSGDQRVGDVALGTPLTAFVAALGEPAFRDSQEDGLYVYAAWPPLGVSAVFLDDLASSVELFEPSRSKTARGVAVGSPESAVRDAYGPPESAFGDRDMGLRTLNYPSLGHAFYLDGDGRVTSISLWSE